MAANVHFNWFKTVSIENRMQHFFCRMQLFVFASLSCWILENYFEGLSWFYAFLHGLQKLCFVVFQSIGSLFLCLSLTVSLSFDISVSPSLSMSVVSVNLLVCLFFSLSCSLSLLLSLTLSLYSPVSLSSLFLPFYLFIACYIETQTSCNIKKYENPCKILFWWTFLCNCLFPC